MDEKIYRPFVNATIETFETMVDLVPVLKAAEMTPPPLAHHDICTILGLSGDGVGMCSLAFSEEVALKIVENFIGEKFDKPNEEVFDAIGEIINIIGGAAKAEMNGLKLAISLPSVMHGKDFHLSLPKNSPVITLTFDIADVGEISLLVSLTLG